MKIKSGDSMSANNGRYDVFVSHASKDKLKYVDKLVEAIKQVGLTVFYDKESIAWGDSIQEKVDEGIESCRLAVVVISKAYFDRTWTEYELKSLLKRQNIEGRKIIMPILYGVRKKELVKHYPSLSDILFKYSKQCSCDEMAKLLKKELTSHEC